MTETNGQPYVEQVLQLPKPVVLVLQDHDGQEVCRLDALEAWLTFQELIGFDGQKSFPIKQVIEKIKPWLDEKAGLSLPYQHVQQVFKAAQAADEALKKSFSPSPASSEPTPV